MTRLELLMSRNIPEDHAREMLHAYEHYPDGHEAAIPRRVFEKFGDPEARELRTGLIS